MGPANFQRNGSAPRTLLLTMLAGAAALAAPAAYAANSSADTSAVVLRPNTLVNLADLEFGPVISGATSGTVAISAQTNARSTTGGVTAASGTAHRAVFQGTGGNKLVIVSGSNSATLTRVGGGAAALTATLTRAHQNGAVVVTLGNNSVVFGGGLQTFYVGGTLTIPANQPDGDYSGTFTVTVNYN